MLRPSPSKEPEMPGMPPASAPLEPELFAEAAAEPMPDPEPPAAELKLPTPTRPRSRCSHRRRSPGRPYIRQGAGALHPGCDLAIRAGPAARDPRRCDGLRGRAGADGRKPEVFEAAEPAEAKAETPAAVKTPAADAELDARGDPSVPREVRRGHRAAGPRSGAEGAAAGQGPVHRSPAALLGRGHPVGDRAVGRQRRSREAPSGDRAQSPLSPLPARRTGWGHPVLRWTAYIAFTSP